MPGYVIKTQSGKFVAIDSYSSGYHYYTENISFAKIYTDFNYALDFVKTVKEKTPLIICELITKEIFNNKINDYNSALNDLKNDRSEKNIDRFMGIAKEYYNTKKISHDEYITILEAYRDDFFQNLKEFR